MAKNTEERKVKVNALLAANAGFADTDRDMLMGLECNQFAAIEALAARPAELPEPTPAVIGNEEELLTALEGQPDLKAKVSLGIETHNKLRTDAIAIIKGNEANVFTDEQLEAKGLEELNALAALAKRPNGDGAAPAANQQQQQDDGTTNFAANGGDPPKANNSTTNNGTVEPMETPRPSFA